MSHDLIFFFAGFLAAHLGRLINFWLRKVLGMP